MKRAGLFTAAAVAAVGVAFLVTNSKPKNAAKQPLPPASVVKAAPAQVPPPMFSPWYAEALRDVLSVEERNVQTLERQLAADPENMGARLKLMAYHQRADRSGTGLDTAKRLRHTTLERQLAADPENMGARLKLMAYHQRADRSDTGLDTAKRLRHTFWLIQHHPESELLHSHVSGFTPAELGSDDQARAVALWEAAVKANPRNAAVHWNAAAFFAELNPELRGH